MRRIRFACLCALAVATVSFRVLPRDAVTTAATAPIPRVDAGPPGFATAAGGPASAAVHAADIAAVQSYFESRHTGLAKQELEALAEIIVTEARRHDLAPGLVLAVIQVESGGYHRAVSPVGALGLMQLMPATGEELARQHGFDWHGPQTLFDPIVNVTLGIAYLKSLSDRYEHVATALAAYNWGPGRIDRRILRGAHVPEIYAREVQEARNRVQL